MKKIITLSVLAAMSMTAAAQDTYTNAEFVNEGLGGTARYIGMGGAMEALGADISTIQSNPAGIGLFRKSTVSGTIGLQNGNGNTIDNDDAKSTTFGFNQLGFVWVNKSGDIGNINIGINYHKSKNFNQILDVTNSLNNASQNKVAYNKYWDGDMKSGWSSETASDELYNKYLMWGGDAISGYQDYMYYYNADKFRFQQMTKGYISDFDFNISGNINNRLYLGLTCTLRDVHYNNTNLYTENLLDGDDVKTGAHGDNYAIVDITDECSIKGTGYSLKFGAIYRPFETSPFRIAAYVHTPTWYKLYKKHRTYFNIDYYPLEAGYYDGGKTGEFGLDYKVTSPWKFGASLGHTIGNNVALGATYEYSDYSAMDNRIIDGYSYSNSYYGTSELSSKDEVMNRNTRQSLQGVHTVKVGAEIRPISQIAIRFGYNYLTAMYKESGVRNANWEVSENRYVEMESQGVWSSGTTAYTNWKATNRFTCGLGFNVGNANIDLAYQYSTATGTFYPFHPQVYDASVVYDQNIPTATDVKDNRHQLSLTLGYRF